VPLMRLSLSDSLCSMARILRMPLIPEYCGWRFRDSSQGSMSFAEAEAALGAPLTRADSRREGSV
jgi:hypothetical protein